MFLVERKPDDKVCVHCDEQIPVGQFAYSRRRKKYYCAECAYALGFISFEQRVNAIKFKKKCSKCHERIRDNQLCGTDENGSPVCMECLYKNGLIVAE